MAYSRSAPEILHGVSLQVAPRKMTAIIGPNACGKSTLLKACGRVLAAHSGDVFLNGRAVSAYGSKEFARIIGLLPQSATAPDGITVADLVARGRYPHQNLLHQWTGDDEAAVARALQRTHTSELAKEPVTALSGGQRQRVWIAMVLAQQTDILLLDEPTTFLDLAHQLDVLDLCRELVDEYGTTIVAVLHDLNQAGRYCDEIIAMHDGKILAHGSPEDVITADLVHRVFGVSCRVIPDPESGTPLVVPLMQRNID
ncbi:ABC transporter ATP-binding protein [Actinobaculum sp. 352]|uniref:ABC transporter ATP-binding protein n=1 Tax=Actinobaculum sp. 352 TaxID=2490946 RepID=UPI00321C13E8